MQREPRARWWVVLLLLAILAAGTTLRAHIHVTHAGMLTLQNDTANFITMAENLWRGGFYIDSDEASRFSSNPYLYRCPTTSDSSRITPYHGCHDLGIIFAYWLAIHVFNNCATPPMLLAWLQIILDCLNILVVFFIGRRLGGRDGLGLCAALAYAALWPPASISATFPFYYPWTGFFALWNLGFLALLLDPDLVQRSPRARLALACVYGVFLGAASMMRSLFLPVAVIAAVWFVVRWRREWRRMAPLALVFLALQVITMSPIFVRNYAHHGRPMVRWVWHAAYTGIGAHPNPCGLTWDDRHAFDFAERHGLRPDDPMFVTKYDEMLHREVVRIWSENPGMFWRNALSNILGGVVGFESVPHVEMHVGRYALVSLWQPPAWLASLLPAPWQVLALLLLSQLLYFFAFLRAQGNAWLYSFVLIQALAVITSISMLCPPFVFYNTCYFPSLAFMLGTAGFAVFHACGTLLRAPLQQSRVLAFCLVAAVVGLALQQQIFMREADFACTWAQMVALALRVLCASALGALVTTWLDARTGGWTAFTALVLMTFFSRTLEPAFGSDYALYALAGCLPLLAMFAERFHPVVSGLLLSLGTLWRPDVALAPFAVMTCLAPGWTRHGSQRSLRASLLVAALVGGLIYAARGTLGQFLPLPFKTVAWAYPLGALLFTWGLEAPWFNSTMGMVARGLLVMILLRATHHQPWAFMAFSVTACWLVHAVVTRMGRRIAPMAENVVSSPAGPAVSPG